MQTIPSDVLKAFECAGTPERLHGGQGNSFLVGNVVLKPIDNIERYAWASELFMIIKSLNPQQTIDLRDQFVAIYRLAFRSAPYHKREDEVIDFAQSLPHHIKKTGFKIVVAFEKQTETVNGFAYGYASTSNDLFNRELVKVIQPDIAMAWLLNSFRLVEMAVRPDAQGQGIGGALHNLLLCSLPYNRAILATMAAETNAYQMYQKRGWQVLVDEIVFPGVPRPYRVMGLDLAMLRGEVC